MLPAVAMDWKGRRSMLRQSVDDASGDRGPEGEEQCARRGLPCLVLLQLLEMSFNCLEDVESTVPVSPLHLAVSLSVVDL